MGLTDKEIQHFLSAHPPQPFQAADDEEGPHMASGSIRATRQAGEQITTMAGRMPVNIALSVATNVPGIMFGVGGAVVGAIGNKVEAHRHAKAVKRRGGKITVTCISCTGLPDLRQMATGFGSTMMQKSTQNPYVKASLLMRGVDYNKENGYNCKTEAHLGGGTDFEFREKTTLTLGFDLTDGSEEADTNAAVLIEVMDQPDWVVGKVLRQDNMRIGVAAFPLYQLVDQMKTFETEDSTSSSHFINLNLYHGDATLDEEAIPNGGILRLHVSMSLNE